MSLKLVAASSQYLVADRAPVATYPFTFATWAVPTFAGGGGGNQCALSLGAGAGASYANFSLGVDGVPEWWLRRDITGGGLDELDVATGIVANSLQFAMGRCYSQTNCRLHILNANGSISSGQTTTSTNPTGITRAVVGDFADFNSLGTGPWDGLLGECWFADIDVFPGAGLAIDEAFFRQIAYAGPFGMGDRIANSVAWYLPFRENIGIERDTNEVYIRSGPRPVWTINGAPELRPELAPGSLIVRPDENSALGIV